MAALNPPKPPKPMRLNETMTIGTDEETESGSGRPYKSTQSTETLVPCRIDFMSPQEAQKYGHNVDETVARVLCPIQEEDGTDIILEHGNQYLTIGGVNYRVIGRGAPQGDSGYQLVTVKREAS